MEKIFLEYTENIEFLKLLTFFIVSFSFTFLGALFTIIRTINKKKGRQNCFHLPYKKGQRLHNGKTCCSK